MGLTMQNRKSVIIIEGIIGAGKSTFSQTLSKTLGPQTLCLLEPDDKDNLNPYLSDFYQNQRRWAFTMQIHLLQKRYRMHLQAQWHALNGFGDAILDRSFQGDTCFLELQKDMETLDQREYETYKSLYQGMTASVLLPTHCILLDTQPEIAIQRISKRIFEREGRKCEVAIDLSYLRKLKIKIWEMAGELSDHGVRIIRTPWDRDLTPEELEIETQRIARKINQKFPLGMAEIHGRKI